jgi:hypothetical protein
MTEYYRSGGIPAWQTDGVPTYINGTPDPRDVEANPYFDDQPCAPYMTQLERNHLPLPLPLPLPLTSDDEESGSRAPATLSRVTSLTSGVPTAITSPAQGPLQIAQPPVLPSSETLI